MDTIENIGEIWRHKKTQGLYEIVTLAFLESNQEHCVVYRSLKNGITWIRPCLEFTDGRFEKVTIL